MKNTFKQVKSCKYLCTLATTSKFVIMNRHQIIWTSAHYEFVAADRCCCLSQTSAHTFGDEQVALEQTLTTVLS